MKKIYCDKCGKDITLNFDNKQIKMPATYYGDTSNSNICEFDVCKGCYNEFLKHSRDFWLDSERIRFYDEQGRKL